MTEEAESDFWTITGEFIYRHNGEPESKLYVPKEETFPIPMNYIDVTRTTNTSLDVLLDKKYWRLLERGWRKKNCQMHWTGFTRFILLNERPPDGFSWSVVESYKETNHVKTRQCMARHVEAYVSCSEKESQTKMGCRETKARQCQTIERNILRWIKRRRIQAHNESRS